LTVIPFAYPDRPDVEEMGRRLQALAASLGTTMEAAEQMKRELADCRRLAGELDDLTWKENLVSGWENHLWLLSSSDFDGDYREYEGRLSEFLSECHQRRPSTEDLRLAYIGVPAVFAYDLYRFVERQGARIVFNEVQRQFAMPRPGNSLAEQYAAYTYPYSISDRLADIIPELRARRVHGLVHYVQAFCHRGIGDIIFRESIDLPVLTLEGNADYILTPQLRTKLEAFLDMLRRIQRQPDKVGDCMKGNSYGLRA